MSSNKLLNNHLTSMPREHRADFLMFPHKPWTLCIIALTWQSVFSQFRNSTPHSATKHKSGVNVSPVVIPVIRKYL